MTKPTTKIMIFGLNISNIYIYINISNFFMQCHLGKKKYNPAILRPGALIKKKKKNKCNTKQHETCHRAARHKKFLFWIQMKV